MVQRVYFQEAQLEDVSPRERLALLEVLLLRVYRAAVEANLLSLSLVSATLPMTVPRLNQSRTPSRIFPHNEAAWTSNRQAPLMGTSPE